MADRDRRYGPVYPMLTSPETGDRLREQWALMNQGIVPEFGPIPPGAVNYNAYAQMRPPIVSQPTAGDTGFIPASGPTPTPVPNMWQQPVGGPGGGVPNAGMPAYTPTTYQLPPFPGVSPARYLPELLEGRSVAEAMPLPQFQAIALPALSGGQMMGFTPDMINQMTGFMSRAADVYNQNQQTMFGNRGTQIDFARTLDADQLNRELSTYGARAQHVDTERGVQAYQNYEPPEVQRQRELVYDQAMARQRFGFEQALLKQKFQYDLAASQISGSNDLALKKQFEIHETNIKNFLAAMDLSDVEALFKGPDGKFKIDIETLMANPSFKLLTNNQKQSILASLQFFANHGVPPETLIGAQTVNSLLQQGSPGQGTRSTTSQPEAGKGRNSSDPLGLRR